MHEFEVAMTCEGCSGALERVLNKHKGMTSFIKFSPRAMSNFHIVSDKGVTNFKIDLPGKRVEITSTLTSDELLAIVKKTGKETKYLGTK